MGKFVCHCFLLPMSSNSNAQMIFFAFFYLSFLARKFYCFMYSKLSFFVLLLTTRQQHSYDTCTPFKIKITSIFRKLLVLSDFSRFLLVLVNYYLSTAHTHTHAHLHNEPFIYFIKDHRKRLSQFSLVRVSLPCTQPI